MGAVRLTRINCVLKHANAHRRQARNTRGAVITCQEQSEMMTIEHEHLFCVELVLLAILREGEETVAARNLQTRPRIPTGISQAPSANQVIVAPVACELQKWLQAWSEAV